MLENKIYKHLSTVSGVSTYIGTRIYPMILPQNPTTPAITYQRIDTRRFYALNGDNGTGEIPRIQMDIWSTSYEQGRNIATAIKAAMDSATAFLTSDYNQTDLYEPDVQLYRIQCDYVIANNE
jgi:hypothetical protein